MLEVLLPFYALLALLALIAVLVVVAFLLLRRAMFLEHELAELGFRKNSQSVRYGKLTEQWMPFLEDFPYDSGRFRFLGDPVDGIVFDEDKLVFCEFKTATSRLSEKQKRIRQLVRDKKVDWLEFSIR